MLWGYQTRRMLVDYHSPLVTNLKNAKLLAEAFSHNHKLEIDRLDYQTSHRTITLPGPINITASVPGLAKEGSKDLELVTRESVAFGFSMIRVLPLGIEDSLTDAKALEAALANSKLAHCDFNYSVAATSTNSQQLNPLTSRLQSPFWQHQ